MTKFKENKDITDIVPEIDITDLPTAETKEDKLIRNLFLYRTVYEAAIKAGYSENTAKSSIYVKLKNERFKNKILPWVWEHYGIISGLMPYPALRSVARS